MPEGVAAPPAEPPARGPRVVATAPAPAPDIKFDTHLKIEDPGELKIKTFRLTKPAIGAIALGVVTLAVWLAAPHGFDQFRPSPLPGTYTEASARFAMVLTAERLDRFFTERGRMPVGLDELGSVASELITYTRLSDSEFRLEAPGMNHALVLETSTPRDRFLGGAIDQLRQSPDVMP